MRGSSSAYWISSGAWMFSMPDLGAAPVERHAGLQVPAHRHRQAVHRSAAPAEPGRADLAGGQFVGFEELRAVQHVRLQLAAVETRLQFLAVVVIAGIAADRVQPVGGEGDKPFDRGAPGDVLDIGVEAAVLVDHEDGRERPVAGRLDQVAAHFARIAAGGIVGDVVRRHPRIRERDRLRVGVARQQGLRHGKPGHAADQGQRRRPRQEFAALHAGVAVFVV